MFRLPRILIATIAFTSALTAHAVCVSTYEANLREGPGPKFKISWTVPKYTPLVALKKQGGWIEVEDQDGQKHWLYAQNATDKYSCLSVKVPVAKLREQASGKSGLADVRQVDKYTAFKRIDRIEEWYQVEASWGGQYWIHESNIWRPMKVTNISY